MFRVENIPISTENNIYVTVIDWTIKDLKKINIYMCVSLRQRLVKRMFTRLRVAIKRLLSSARLPDSFSRRKSVYTA